MNASVWSTVAKFRSEECIAHSQWVEDLRSSQTPHEANKKKTALRVKVNYSTVE